MLAVLTDSTTLVATERAGFAPVSLGGRTLVEAAYVALAAIDVLRRA